MTKYDGSIPVTGTLTTTDTADTYATHIDSLGKGGYRVVETAAERDAISSDRRTEGMLVYVLDESEMYQLIGGVDNSNWVQPNFDTLSDLAEGYIFVGNAEGQAEESTALIDLELDLTDLELDLIEVNGRLDELQGSTPLVREYTNAFPAAQVISDMQTGFLFHASKGKLVSLDILTNDHLPGLTEGHIRIGDANNRPTQIVYELNTIPVNGDVDLNGFNIINSKAPINGGDLANKDYVDSVVSSGSENITLNGAVTGSGVGTITTTLTPINTSQITDFDSSVKSYQLDQFQAPISAVDMGGQLLSNLSNPVASDDAATKFYVDNTTSTLVSSLTLDGFVTGSTSGNIITTTRGASCLLTNIPAGGNVNMGNNIISNMANPTNPQDAATKFYVDSVASGGGSGNVTLTGAVTGSGTGTINTTLTPINTSQISNFNSAVITFRLDQFQAPNTSLSMGGQKLINLSNPTNSSDGATKFYVDNAISNKATTLTGAVTGSGTGTINTTLTAINTSQISNFNAAVTAYRLNQFQAPNSALSVGGQKLINLANPTNASDGATKSYVDSLVSSGSSTTLTGAVTGSGIGTINTTLTPINTSQISNFNSAVTAYRLDQFQAPNTSLSMGGQRIINVNTPVSGSDAVNKSYVDSLNSNSGRGIGLFGIQNSSTVINLTANVPTKISNSDFGRYTGGWWDYLSVPGRITFLNSSRSFNCTGLATVLSSSTLDANINLELVKNGALGVLYPVFPQRVSTNIPQTLSLQPIIVDLNTNDYLELFITSTVNTTVTVQKMICTLLTV